MGITKSTTYGVLVGGVGCLFFFFALKRDVVVGCEDG